MIQSILLFVVINISWLLGEWMIYMIVTWKYCTIFDMFSACVACRIVYAIVFGITFLGIIGAISGNKLIKSNDKNEKEEQEEDE